MPPTSPPRFARLAPLLIPALTGTILVSLLLALHGFSPELRKDEHFYWPASLHFSHRWLPSLEDLRTYPAPTTPLPFLLFGALEHLTGHGLILGRLANALLALGISVAICGRRDLHSPRPALSALGLLLFPYFLGVSVFLYTDTLPTAFGVMGILAWIHRRHALSALCMAMAIACRQYMVAFPAALAAWGFCSAWRSGGASQVVRTAASWLPHTLAAATLGLWFVLFNGPAPAAAAQQFGVSTSEPARILIRNSLYSLTCIGAYFVVVETALFRRGAILSDLRAPRTTVAAIILAALFCFVPPLQNTNHPFPEMGYLDRGARAMFADVPRMVLFWAFAVLALARLSPRHIAFWLLLANAVVMAKSHIGWDKYAMPLLAILWTLRSRDWLDPAMPPRQ